MRLNSENSSHSVVDPVVIPSTSPLSPGLACILTGTFVFFPEGDLWSWKGAQFICGSMAGNAKDLML